MLSFGNGLTVACMLLTLAGSVCAQTAEPAADALADRVAADTRWSPARGLTYRYRTGGGP